MIEAEFRVAARDGLGAVVGLSEWRSVYLEKEFR
jgi:hypothetical protein